MQRGGTVEEKWNTRFNRKNPQRERISVPSFAREGTGKKKRAFFFTEWGGKIRKTNPKIPVDQKTRRERGD